MGRISQEKGVDKILEVWRGICHEEKYKEWRLVIVGDGEKKKTNGKVCNGYGTY